MRSTFLKWLKQYINLREKTHFELCHFLYIQNVETSWKVKISNFSCVIFLLNWCKLLTEVKRLCALCYRPKHLNKAYTMFMQAFIAGYSTYSGNWMNENQIYFHVFVYIEAIITSPSMATKDYHYVIQV